MAGSTSPVDGSARPLGSPRLVADFGRLVAEPLVLVVPVRHSRSVLAYVVSCSLGALAQVAFDLAGHGILGWVALLVVALTAVTAWGVAADRRRGVPIGSLGGALGVSATRVYVARGSWFVQSPREISESVLLRDARISVGPPRTVTRDLRLRLSTGRDESFDVPTGWGANQDALRALTELTGHASSVDTAP
jgi:hypothetical protein